MAARFVFFAIIFGVSLCVTSTGWTDVPAPPVNQALGMLDVLSRELTEDDCRACHKSGVPDRHHVLYGEDIPSPSIVPNPDADGDGNDDTVYTCSSCHDQEVVDDVVSFKVERDCQVCHGTGSAHHRTPAAANGDCVSCHGDIVDNINDGHYIPKYSPSAVTPSTGDGDGLPLNSRGKGAGACDYCHDDDGLEFPVIRNNADLHHTTTYVWDGSLDCLVCHEVEDGQDPLDIRTCERCHGPDSLHNIQADSVGGPNDDGIIVVGGEDAGFGHVGRDAGPGDSDCWGCHGFAAASAPRSGPIIPTVYDSDAASIPAGSDTMVTLTGASFINTVGASLYESKVALTAADGSSVMLTPDIILDQGTLVVTIPGDTAPGNYDLRSVKDEVASNPTVISITPAVTINRAIVRGTSVIITGGGFSGFAAGSGTSVTARVNRQAVEGTIISWSDARIVASFGSLPPTVTVNSVFGNATVRVSSRKAAR